MYLNISSENMDYLSPTSSIVYFTLQRSLIMRNLIVHSPFSQGKINDAFCAAQFPNHNDPSGFQKKGFWSADRCMEACWIRNRQEDRFLISAMSTLLGVKPTDSKEDLQSTECVCFHSAGLIARMCVSVTSEAIFQIHFSKRVKNVT
jgi:hypothetical protein